MIKETTIFLAQEEDTLLLGRKLAKNLPQGLLIFLRGDLGAGKTTLVRGLLATLGHTGSVKSPSYNLIEQYQINNVNLNHIDLYRFNSPEEWVSAGFNEFINDLDVTMIEWAEKAKGVLCEPDVMVEILYEKSGGREASIYSFSKKGTKYCSGLT
jgi:tRNA threonylcarbamoyladenosine biosynthesis protein TsaE